MDAGFRVRGPFWIVVSLLGCLFGCASGSQEPLDKGPSVAPPSGTAAAGAPGFAPQAGSAAGAPSFGNPQPAVPSRPGTVSTPMNGMTGSAGGTAVPPVNQPMGTAGSNARPPMPMAGAAAAGSGAGAAGQPAGPAMPAPAGKMDPVIPAMAGECPTFRSGSITLMGLSGIEVVAGTKPAGPTGPMVFYWHGTGGLSGEYGLQASAVQRGVMQEGGVLISFQGTTGGDLLSGTFIFGSSDFKLTDQLVACAVKNQNVDPRQIFATGCSAGGLFSAAMAAERSGYMAAVAPNSGGWTIPVAFQNMHTPALMTIHGAAGVDVVAVDFSVTSQTADDAFKRRGAYVINCDHGGVHCGGGSLAPDIWKFFKAHPFGAEPSPWKDALPAGFNRVCKIY